MRAIERAISELLGVLTAGFIAFFVMLTYAAGLLLLLACGFVCAGFLLVALFTTAMWLSTRDTHALYMMVTYFGYAGGAFAVIAALSYYHGKLMDGVKLRQRQRIRHYRASHHWTNDLHCRTCASGQRSAEPDELFTRLLRNDERRSRCHTTFG